MTTIKTPIETDLIVKINDLFVEYEYSFSAPHGDFSIYDVAKHIEKGINAEILNVKCIESYTSEQMIDFAQHLLKDFCTIEVTQETLNNFLNKK